MTSFQQAVVDAVRKVPYGRVVSYGQVATHLGSPRAARQVGWMLRSLKISDLPWWRVINNAGRISIKNDYLTPDDQRSLLQQEGVEVDELFNIDIEKYRFFYPL